MSRAALAAHYGYMNGKTGNRVIVWALACSLAAHAIFAIVVRNMPRVEAAPEQPPTHIDIVRRAAPPPTPTPAPTPQPHRVLPAAPVPAHAPRVRVAVPRSSANAAGNGTQHPAALATAGSGGDGLAGPAVPEAPTPTPRPACPNPNVPAHALEAAAPETPDDATGLPATASVAVTLDALGRVTGATIYRSTNDMRLDRAALVAARASTYAPAVVECEPTGGTYLFRVDFQD